MTVRCRCERACEAAVPPQRKTYRGPGTQDVWICLFCNDAICVGCYAQHTARVHAKAGKR